MSENYEKVRIFLFANSYSAGKIVVYLKEKYKGRKLEKSAIKLATVLRFERKQTTDFVLLGAKPRRPYRRMPTSIRIYLEIEKELMKLSEEKLDEYSTATEDYQRQLMLPAIERASGHSLTDVKNDQKFNDKLEEKIRVYRNTYYKVAYKYKLPTIRIVPFLTRLVGL